MPTNFELKRLKPKLDIVKKPENRVHELTDSNVSQLDHIICLPNGCQLSTSSVHNYEQLSIIDGR